MGAGGGNTNASCQLTPSRPFLFKMLSRLILGRTRKFIHPPWYKLGGGGGGRLNLSQEFLICCSISKQCCVHGKAFDLLNKMRYILWVAGLLEACDVTNNGRYLGFYQELEIRLKSPLMVILVLDV